MTPQDVLDSEERFAELLKLQENWDSYGALPPSQEAVGMARNFLAFLPPLIPAPWIGPGVDQNIALEWHRNSWDLELEFGEGETVVFGSNSDTGYEFEGPLEECDEVFWNTLQQLKQESAAPVKVR